MSGVADVKILLVDDYRSNLDALEAMLGSSGCTLIRAESADEALLALLRHEFAAMILDIKMPGMDGIELARLVKQRRRTEHVPILFLTAHSVEERDVLLGYGAGAVDYLSKPVNAEILRSKVAVFIDLFLKTRELARLNEVLGTQIAERLKAQAALEMANEELERRVYERTMALTIAHRGVEENEERLRMAVEVAQVAAWDWNLQSGAMHWSTDPEKLFGFPQGAFGSELRIARALHPDDRHLMEAAIERALTTGNYECEFRAVRSDGSVVWITDRGRVVRDGNGEADRIVGISRDVTAQRRAEWEREQLLASERKAKEEAERQSRMKDEFVATVSHELRTPMNVILGWLHLVTTGKSPGTTATALSVIQRNARLQAHLIDDLLDINRLTAGHVQLDVTTVDIAAVVRGSVQALQPVADEKGVQFAVAIEPAGIAIIGDPGRLQQIVWNLLNNAIKFNRPGGRVDVQVCRQSGGVQISIDDTGRGISAESLPHVFEKFWQEDSSKSRAVGGLGLGLAITRHLVELHGGQIEVSSRGEGLGATFVVRLPLDDERHAVGDTGQTPDRELAAGCVLDGGARAAR
jgi:PAS domain S-box-containing protein